MVANSLNRAVEGSSIAGADFRSVNAMDSSGAISAMSGTQLPISVRRLSGSLPLTYSLRISSQDQ